MLYLESPVVTHFLIQYLTLVQDTEIPLPQQGSKGQYN